MTRRPKASPPAPLAPGEERYVAVYRGKRLGAYSGPRDARNALVAAREPGDHSGGKVMREVGR